MPLDTDLTVLLRLPITSERLEIRKAKQEDEPKIITIQKDPEIKRYIGRIEWSQCMVISLLRSCQVAGICSLQQYPREAPCEGDAEVTLELCQGFRGKGLAQETLQALIDACHPPEIRRLIARIDLTNKKALKLISCFH